MALDFNNIMVGTMQLEEMTAFYKKIFDKDPDWSDGGFCGWQVKSCAFALGEHSEMGGKAKDPGRVLLNFTTEDVKGEFDKAVAAGAEVVKEPYEMGGGWIATLADPDGNLFQFTTPWDPESM